MVDHPASEATTSDAWLEARLPLKRGTAGALVSFWMICLLVGVAWFQINAIGLFFLAGAAACLVISLPLLWLGKSYDWLSPWTLVLVGGYVGYGVRGFAISVGVSGSRSVDQLFLLGRQPDYFIWPTALFLMALVAMTLGYLLPGTPRRPRRPTRLLEGTLDPLRMQVVVVLCAVIGFAAFLMYVRLTGGLSDGSLSGKRAVINGINLDTSLYESHGEYRVINQFSTIAFLLQLAYFSKRRIPHGPTRLAGWFVGVLFLNACLLPVFSSTRATIIYLVLGAAFVELMLGARIRRSAVVGAFIVIIGGTSVLTALRSVDQGVTPTVTVTSRTVMDTFVMTRTFSDIPTSGNIIRAVPQYLAPANGSTITAWLLAPVPRSVWANKPIVSQGPLIGSVLYGSARSGVPPGMIAESYWNFGWQGMLAIPFVTGLIMRALQNWLSSHSRRSAQAAVLSGAVTLRFGLDALSNSVGYAMFQLLQTMILLLPVLWAVSSNVVSPLKVRKQERPPV